MFIYFVLKYTKYDYIINTKHFYKIDLKGERIIIVY